MMQRPPLLYLAHRIPFPPNKGDKVRSFNILRHLSSRYRVHLASFYDMPEDRRHLGALDEWCQASCVEYLRPRAARIASLRGLLAGEALTLPYYRSARLADWVREQVATHRIKRAVVFSGAMAQYLEGLDVERCVIDFCDVDSAKWSQYADDRQWPMSWLYRREGRRLGEFERDWAARADACTFVTAAERALFLSAGTVPAGQVHVIENGVDTGYFDPATAGRDPYPPGRPTIVFSGAMDYWPNVDGACWFATEILPLIRRRRPDAAFVVVGMNPTSAVSALAQPGVVEVTGTVPDVRPFVAHADVVVAPLRVARGIQNKVLEAMSLGRPVVVSDAAATGLRATEGSEFRAAGDAAGFAERVLELLDPARGNAVGEAARRRVLADYAWQAHLATLDDLLEGVEAPTMGSAAGAGG